MWNKFEFIDQAACLYPQFEKYIWIDFGLESVVKQCPSQDDLNYILSRFHVDLFCCTVLNPL